MTAIPARTPAPQVRALRDSDGPDCSRAWHDWNLLKAIRVSVYERRVFRRSPPPAGRERLGHRDHQPLGRVRTGELGLRLLIVEPQLASRCSPIRTSRVSGP